MTVRMTMTALASVVVLAASAASADAQILPEGWWDPVSERDVRDRDSGKRGGGPPFCRNGEGHPVHGWRWCEEKGWGGGGASWSREGGWDDVIFGRRAPSREGRVREPVLGGIFGDIVLGRLQRLGRDLGLGGALDGRWVPLAGGGSVMQLRMGGVPLAELADLDRDGRAEVVMLNRRR